MRQAQMIPWLTLVLLYFLIVLERKLELHLFKLNYEVPATASWFKRFFARRSDHIRYGALFIFWLAANVFAMQIRRQPGEEWFFLLAIAAGGLLVYFVAAVLIISLVKTGQARQPKC